MATHAIAGKPIKFTAYMTRLACGTCMRSRQWEARETVVKGCWFPCIGAVASGAVGAILPTVLIVEQMAGDALRCCNDKVVFKVGWFPAFCCMAEGAIFAKAPNMSVIFHVARVAIYRGILRVIGGMTIFAFGIQMLAFEREVRQIVIKCRGLPTCGGVANRTICSKFLLVCIIFQVAASTIFGRVLKIFDAAGVLMAFNTTLFGVLACEREASLIVVKICTVAFDAIVAGETILVIRRNMRLCEASIQFLMAFAARILCKRGDALRMAVCAIKGSAIGFDLMGCQREADQLMRECCWNHLG